MSSHPSRCGERTHVSLNPVNLPSAVSFQPLQPCWNISTSAAELWRKVGSQGSLLWFQAFLEEAPQLPPLYLQQSRLHVTPDKDPSPCLSDTNIYPCPAVHSHLCSSKRLWGLGGHTTTGFSLPASAVCFMLAVEKHMLLYRRTVRKLFCV